MDKEKPIVENMKLSEIYKRNLKEFWVELKFFLIILLKGFVISATLIVAVWAIHKLSGWEWTKNLIIIPMTIWISTIIYASIKMMAFHWKSLVRDTGEIWRMNKK